MPPFSCNFLARKSLSSLLCKTFEAKIQSTFLLIKVAMHPKNYISRGKNKKTHVFDYFQTQCFYAFLEWIEALWSQKQSFKNSVVEVPIPFPKYTRYLHHLWYEVDKMTCQRKAEWCANFLSTWKVQKSAFHCFVINPQLACRAAFGCQFPSFVLAKAPVQQLCGYGLLYHGWKAKQGGEKKKSSFRGIL